MFKWKDEYSVGVEEINKQHKKLFALGRKLYEIVQLDDDYDHYDEIMTILDELKEYTSYHFESEEQLLNKHEYNSLEFKLHRLEHKSFINKINEYDEENIDFEQKHSILDMLTFIEKWIQQHILKTDFQYKDFFNTKGVS
ncbi:bacteriohemerythrin [Clostridium aestuarii]|uniref:Bacteriohemerythrin n=1 Tax=Clostridium aestuarii TaxID=338193 RepID=A0ABT4D377_9CLOT|nr:bacteriohemerythrin [Clostridium aestuarii]MCY6485684.1 bacteriohemerythrin [Clostridium aestuarii]